MCWVGASCGGAGVGVCGWVSAGGVSDGRSHIHILEPM